MPMKRISKEEKAEKAPPRAKVGQEAWEDEVLGFIAAKQGSSPAKALASLSPAQFRKLKLWGVSEKYRRARSPGQAADRLLNLESGK